MKSNYHVLLAGVLVILSAIGINAQENIANYNLLQSGGSITTSESSNSSFVFLNDRNDTTFYIVENFNTESWIMYESPVPIVVTGYSMVSSYDTTYNPKKWTFEYSDNGTQWTSVHTMTGTFPSACSALNVRTGLSGSSALHQFYRLKILTDNPGQDGRFSIAELQLFGNPDTFDKNLTANGGVLTGQYPGITNEELKNVIDNRTNKFCQTGTSSFWIQYESSVPVILEKYSLTTAWTAKRFPRTWQLLASNDGLNWDVLDVQKNKNFFDAPYSRQYFQINEQPASIHWDNYANLLYESLIKNYWTAYAIEQNLNRPVINYFKQTSAPSEHTGYNYWWMAHALDIIVDGFNRTANSKEYRQRMNQMYSGIEYFGNTHSDRPFWNLYYDDMEWMGLALLRAYEAFGDERFLTQSLNLFGWTVAGWSDVNYGGIAWNSGSGVNSKNACSNGPALIWAARLYNFYKDKDAEKAQYYLNWAKKIYNWMNNYLADTLTGYVWDGFGNTSLSNVYTYNIGTWMGGCLELYLITGEDKYIRQAVLSADCVVNDIKKFSPYGILYNGENGGDGGLFKCIFLRYLSQMIMRGNLPEDTKNNYVNYFRDNGITLWNAGVLKPEMIASKKFFEQPDGPAQDASVQICGVMIFELLDELKREGFLPDKNAVINENARKGYKYFRLNIQVNYGDSASEISEWQLFGTDNTNIGKTSLEPALKVYGTNEKIHIENPQGKQITVNVFDTNGRKLKSELYNSPYCVIPVSQKGTYIVRIVEKGTSYGYKIIF